jgi:bacterioferritin-associated ferredoxin
MTDMYICLCNAIRQSEIEKAIDEGAVTLEALQETLEVAVNCGACTQDVLEILERKKNAKDV